MKITREHQHYRVYADGFFEYTDSGLDYYREILKGVGIRPENITSLEDHDAALNLCVESDIRKLQNRTTPLSLEAQLLLAVLTQDDNKKAFSIRDKIRLRDSFDIIEGGAQDTRKH